MHMLRGKIKTNFAYEPCIGQELQHVIYLGMRGDSIGRNTPGVQAQPERNVGRQTRIAKPHVLIGCFRHAEKVLVSVRLRILMKARIVLKVTMGIKLRRVKLHRARSRRSPLRSIETCKLPLLAHARPFPCSIVLPHGTARCHVLRANPFPCLSLCRKRLALKHAALLDERADVPAVEVAHEPHKARKRIQQ